MSINPLVQQGVGSSTVPDIFSPNAPAANDNAAIARNAVSNGQLDGVGRAAAKAFMNPETANGTAIEQQPGYVGPEGIAVPGMPSRGFGTAKVVAPAVDTPDTNRNAPQPASGRASDPAGAAGDADKSARSAGGDEPAGSRVRNGGVNRDNAGAASGAAWGSNFQTVGGEDASVNKQQSATFSSMTVGNAENGRKGEVQGGAWSKTATQTQNDADGVAARATAEGSAGGQVNGGFSKTSGEKSIDGNGSAWGGAQGRTSAGASASRDSGVYAHAGVEGRVGAGAEGKTTFRAGPAEVGLTGGAAVGAETSNGVHFGARTVTPEERAAGITGSTGASVSGGGYVGAKVEGGVKAGVGGNTVGVNGAVYAGVGASAKFEAGVEKDDKGRSYLNLGGSVGAALGIGGKIGLDLRINITPLLKAFDSTKEVVGKVFNEVKKVVTKGVDAVKDFGHKIADGAKDFGNKVADGFKSVGNKIGKFFGAA
jgi:hypothetical protein